MPEDRANGAGRQIRVRVAIIPATAGHRRPDPIVWFAGGPGGSAVDMMARVRPLIAQPARDLVFIDQRGTGSSNLTCPTFPGLQNKTAPSSPNAHANPLAVEPFPTWMPTGRPLGFRHEDAVGRARRSVA